jgi:hypothetical protein
MVLEAQMWLTAYSHHYFCLFHCCLLAFVSTLALQAARVRPPGSCAHLKILSLGLNVQNGAKRPSTTANATNDDDKGQTTDNTTMGFPPAHHRQH